MSNKIISNDVAKKATPAPSFVKLAMKNMVRKGSQSLFHFGLTALGFLGFILIIAVLGKPNIPQ
tara:strand:+ start:183 stop:374 length:192 start_codon:yes stop_codon:yes gene_type:complete